MVDLRRRRVRSDRGASSLELAILGPAVLLMTFISIQFALWYHAKNVAQSAVEAGARASRAYQATDSDGVQVARTVFGNLDGGAVTDGGISVTASRTSTTVTLRLDAQSVSLLPGMTFPVHVTAGGPIEQFVPAP